jgi:antitoxin (DNA-binding transcriptional repressor) of toxin-antitoxin stability system
MHIKIGSYEAKTKLPELLRGIQAGKRYTITRNGEAIAELGPADGQKTLDTTAAVDDMLAFMQAHRAGTGVDLSALMAEGRE